MVSRSVRDVIHFYYCLSVAIKIHRKYSTGVTVININIFILKWLDQARKNQAFRRTVLSEIDWLTGYIKSQGPLFRYAEKLIDSIYNTSETLLRKKTECHICI